MAVSSLAPASTAATLQQTIAPNAGGTVAVTIPATQGFVFANIGNIVSGWVPAANIARFPTSPTARTYYSYLVCQGNQTIYLYY